MARDERPAEGAVVALLSRAREARARGDLAEASEWLARARSSRERVPDLTYPDVVGAIELEFVEQMLARGETGEARAVVPEIIERLRRTVCTEAPVELVAIEIALIARIEGAAAVRGALERWERRARRDWGAGTGVHDRIVEIGLRTLLRCGAVDDARAEVRRITELIERRGGKASPSLQTLRDEIG